MASRIHGRRGLYKEVERREDENLYRFGGCGRNGCGLVCWRGGLGIPEHTDQLNELGHGRRGLHGHPYHSVRFNYSYAITNNADQSPSPVAIRAFTLGAPGPGGDLASLFTSITSPTGWTDTVVTGGGLNQIDWNTNTAADYIPGGGSATFSFDAPNPPNVTCGAFAQNTATFSGTSVWPAPTVPEASTLMLGLTGLMAIPGLRKLKIR